MSVQKQLVTDGASRANFVRSAELFLSQLEWCCEQSIHLLTLVYDYSCQLVEHYCIANMREKVVTAFSQLGGATCVQVGLLCCLCELLILYGLYLIPGFLFGFACSAGITPFFTSLKESEEPLLSLEHTQILLVCVSLNSLRARMGWFEKRGLILLCGIIFGQRIQKTLGGIGDDLDQTATIMLHMLKPLIRLNLNNDLA